MNEQEHLIDCLMEEAAEVIVEASKCLRFTLDQKYIESNFTNRERLQREIKDLFCVARLLHTEGILDTWIPSDADFARKRDKIKNKFMKLSREYGALT